MSRLFGKVRPGKAFVHVEIICVVVACGRDDVCADAGQQASYDASVAEALILAEAAEHDCLARLGVTPDVCERVVGRFVVANFRQEAWDIDVLERVVVPLTGPLHVAVRGEQIPGRGQNVELLDVVDLALHAADDGEGYSVRRGGLEFPDVADYDAHVECSFLDDQKCVLMLRSVSILFTIVFRPPQAASVSK